MKNLMMSVVLCGAAMMSLAMPAKPEIEKAKSLVSELMAPKLAALRAKSLTEAQVGDAAVEFAKEAKGEAAKYQLLRGAVTYYLRAEEFDKAADAVEMIKKTISDVPASEICSLLSRPLGKYAESKIGRLGLIYRTAKAEATAAKDLPALAAKAKKGGSASMTEYAEALAASGDWSKALKQFAELKDTREIAKAEQSDKSDVTVADFWWNYSPVYKIGKDAFRFHARDIYRKLLDANSLDGLKKTLVEQRIASLTPEPVAPGGAASAENGEAEPPADAKHSKVVTAAATPSGTRAQRGHAVKDPSGIIHRWSFAEDLNDSVTGQAPANPGQTKVDDGCAVTGTNDPIVLGDNLFPVNGSFTLLIWASAKREGTVNEMVFTLGEKNEHPSPYMSWSWVDGMNKWVGTISAFGEKKKIGHGDVTLNNVEHCYAVTGTKEKGEIVLNFYYQGARADSFRGKIWKKIPTLFLGGNVHARFNEVRIYSRALTASELAVAVSAGPDKVEDLK